MKLNYQDIKEYSKLLNPRQLKSNKKLIIYLVFVSISSMLWFLNSLSKEYVADINFDIKYYNLPTDRVLVGKTEKNISLRVKNYGFEIMKYKIKSIFANLKINLIEELELNTDTLYSGNHSLNSNTIIKLIESKLASNLNIIRCQPANLDFKFKPYARKKVPIILNLDYILKQQYMQDGKTELSVDSVMIRGEEENLKRINFIKNESKDLGELSKSKRVKLDLIIPTNVFCDTREIEAIIPIVKYTEAVRECKINKVSVPDSLVLRLFPDKLKLKYFVDEQKYETIEIEDFNFIVDFNKIKHSKKLKIEMIDSAVFVSNIRYSPDSVSYIIEKKIIE
ncbi:MAG: hypothetical protein N4A49_04275 [Marinifilaceae bacterium]|nr:hypothetical protein [Marinifilaceae bacterium]